MIGKTHSPSPSFHLTKYLGFCTEAIDVSIIACSEIWKMGDIMIPTFQRMVLCQNFPLTLLKEYYKQQNPKTCARNWWLQATTFTNDDDFLSQIIKDMHAISELSISEDNDCMARAPLSYRKNHLRYRRKNCVNIVLTCSEMILFSVEKDDKFTYEESDGQNRNS